jgi:hypothetical protein
VEGNFKCNCLAHAGNMPCSGLRDLIAGASADAQLYVYGVIAIFAVGIVGKAGGMILSACGDGRTGRLVTRKLILRLACRSFYGSGLGKVRFMRRY